MILMLFPPQWTTAAPSIGIPILKSHLEKASFKVDVKDLNISFFNSLLTKDYLESALKKTEKILPKLKNQIEHININLLDDLPLDEQSIVHKYNMINEFMITSKDSLSKIIQNIEHYKQVYRDEKDFYNIRKFINAQNNIEKAIQLAQLPYAPTCYYFTHHSNPILKYNFDNIKYHVFSKENNIFLDYYPQVLPNIINKDYKLIAISINSNSQLIPGLTLGYLLKQKYPHTHINIGGDYFTRISSNLYKYKDVFNLYTDTILTGDAESSIINLAEYTCNGKGEISSVPGLIYKNNDNQVITNELEKLVDMCNVLNINLDGYNLKEYFSPSIVLPLKSSRHCQWNKCLFCDLYYGKDYSEKPPEILIENIKELKNKYNISSFEFMDSAISPEYYNKFANLILKEKLNINFYSFARIESGFNKKLLNKLNKAGLKMLVWGYESASDRLIKIMNKKMDLKNRYKILKTAYDEGIFNLMFTMLGFPTETMEECKLTMDTLASKLDYLNPIPPSICVVNRHSKLLKFMRKNNIDFKIDEDVDFDIGIDYACGKDKYETIYKLREEGLKKYRESYSNGFPLYNLIKIRAHLHLYISFYGTKRLMTDRIFHLH